MWRSSHDAVSSYCHAGINPPPYVESVLSPRKAAVFLKVQATK